MKKLVGLKHSYKGEVTQLEADLRAKFEQELETAEKDLKEKYLEKVVDWFYTNGFNCEGSPPAPSQPEIEVIPSPMPTPDLQVTVTPNMSGTQTQASPEEVLQPTGPGAPVLYCDECGNRVTTSDKYCSQCAAPLGKPKFTAAGHMRSLPVERERMIRIARQTTTAPTPEVADRRVNDWARTRRR